MRVSLFVGICFAFYQLTCLAVTFLVCITVICVQSVQFEIKHWWWGTSLHFHRHINLIFNTHSALGTGRFDRYTTLTEQKKCDIVGLSETLWCFQWFQKCRISFACQCIIAKLLDGKEVETSAIMVDPSSATGFDSGWDSVLLLYLAVKHRYLPVHTCFWLLQNDRDLLLDNLVEQINSKKLSVIVCKGNYISKNLKCLLV